MLIFLSVGHRRAFSSSGPRGNLGRKSRHRESSKYRRKIPLQVVRFANGHGLLAPSIYHATLPIFTFSLTYPRPGWALPQARQNANCSAFCGCGRYPDGRAQVRCGVFCEVHFAYRYSEKDKADKDFWLSSLQIRNFQAYRSASFAKER